MNIAGLTQTDIAIYGAVAALLPSIIALINRPHFPSWAKQLIMFVIALAAGFVTYGFKNDWNFNAAGLTAALTGVWLATQAAYLVFWNKALAPAIEANVNGGKKAHAAVAPDAAEPIVEDVPEGYDTPTVGKDSGPADEEPVK